MGRELWIVVASGGGDGGGGWSRDGSGGGGGCSGAHLIQTHPTSPRPPAPQSKNPPKVKVEVGVKIR